MVIGYSNEVDIAVIRVSELAGQVPLELESFRVFQKLGEEVITLRSPKGSENTATLGNISGVEGVGTVPFSYAIIQFYVFDRITERRKMNVM